MFKVTIDTVEKTFDQINKKVFDGILSFYDLDVVDIDYLDTEWGFCIEEDGEIVLGLTDEFRSKKDFQNTLCHEMIHLWQIMNGFKVNHGKRFEDMCERSKTYGYDA